MLYILSRFFGKQRKVIAVVRSKYVPDVWYVTFCESPYFTLRWDTRNVKHGETQFMERRPDGSWFQIQEDGDDLDAWVWEQIKREQQRRWNRVVDDVHLMA